MPTYFKEKQTSLLEKKKTWSVSFSCKNARPKECIFRLTLVSKIRQIDLIVLKVWDSVFYNEITEQVEQEIL